MSAMVISHKHRFIFVHVPKSAGSSVTRILNQYTDRSARIRVRAMAERAGLAQKRISLPHESVRAIKERLPARTFGGYLKFAFVRNPWDWHVSHYHYARATPKHKRHAIFKRFSGFDEYIDWIVDNGYSQHQILADKDGRLLVDFVGRFETLQEDLNRILRLLYLPPVSLPHVNRTDHRDYRSYYTPHTRKLIGEARRLDVDTFGYDFNGLLETGVMRAFSSRANEKTQGRERWPSALRRYLGS